MLLKKVLFLTILCCCNAQYEGDPCVKDGTPGKCVLIGSCKSAIEDIKNRRRPQRCGYKDVVPIVCCLDDAGTIKPATTMKPVRTTTEYTPAVYDYQDLTRVGQCEDIPRDLTSPKTGQKAFDKCIEYQEKYVYPCQKGVALTGEWSRANNCHHNADQLIIGGNDTLRNEFPHMAMLGYGDNINNLQWLCGGSVISEHFVITAAHCAVAPTRDPVSHVLVGAYTRSDARKTTNIYKLRKAHRHPDYKPPSKYNDIMLLETEKPMRLSDEVVPACLDVGGQVDDSKVLATGWGLTTNKGSVSEILQKVILHKFTNDECSYAYRNTPMRYLRIGFDAETQKCYGDKEESKDTCQGDSGGPIQIKSKRVNCMYTIVGITSGGMECGFVGIPALYTRVAHYVPWIERTVWP